MMEELHSLAVAICRNHRDILAIPILYRIVSYQLLKYLFIDVSYDRSFFDNFAQLLFSISKQFRLSRHFDYKTREKHRPVVVTELN